MEANGDKNDYFCALFSRKGHANIMTQTLENNNRSNLNKSGVHTHSGCEVRRERDYYTVSLCNGSFFTNTRKKKSGSRLLFQFPLFNFCLHFELNG